MYPYESEFEKLYVYEMYSYPDILWQEQVPQSRLITVNTHFPWSSVRHLNLTSSVSRSPLPSDKSPVSQVIRQ